MGLVQALQVPFSVLLVGKTFDLSMIYRNRVFLLSIPVRSV